MGLPIQAGMAEVLKLSNCKRAKKLKYQQTEKANKKKIQSKSKHRGEEQDQRKAWGKRQKILHSYGPEGDDDGSLCTPTRTRKGQSRKIVSDTGGKASSTGKRPCMCGSPGHSRTSHRDCPLNKRNVTTVASCAPVTTTADSGNEVSGPTDELFESQYSGREYYSSEDGSGDEQSRDNSSDEGSSDDTSDVPVEESEPTVAPVL